MSPPAISNHQPLNCKTPLPTAVRDVGISHQVLKLNEHVELREAVVRREPTAGRDILGKTDGCWLGVVKPGSEVRSIVQRSGRQHGLHRAASRMPADDDVRDVQDLHCIFNGARLGEIAGRKPVSRGGRHQIANIAHGEEFTGIGRNQQVWRDPAVGTGDEQRIGRLPVGELAEVLGVSRQLLLAELDDPPDQLVHWTTMQLPAHSSNFTVANGRRHAHPRWRWRTTGRILGRKPC